MTKKLIIIDDSSTQLNALKTLFANDGWDVCGVQNAKIGYELIFDFAPDLVITDAIMPLMGGFQLIKNIRNDKHISKIPVIVYSILNESNAKYYLSEDSNEYFLKKDDNQDELLNLARKLVRNFPLDKEYKENILTISRKRALEAQKEELIEQEEIKSEINIEEEKFDIEKFENSIKKYFDFSLGDEKIFKELFDILNDSLKYDLSIINVFSFESLEKKAYFDIRNIILSPIFKNAILKKYDSSTGIMYKKYAPDLTTIVNENEFLSKIEFDFQYKDENIANIAFYSRQKLKWEDKEINQKLKDIFMEFFKLRYIKKSSQINKEDIKGKYRQKNGIFEDLKNTKDAFFAIIQIPNFSEIAQNLAMEEIDILNSKISEKIINCLNQDEQIYKTDEGEYNLVIYAQSENYAKYRFEYIINKIEQMEENLELFISASSCNIENEFNIIEAQKRAKKISEEAQQEKVVIYHV